MKDLIKKLSKEENINFLNISLYFFKNRYSKAKQIFNKLNRMDKTIYIELLRSNNIFKYNLILKSLI